MEQSDVFLYALRVLEEQTIPYAIVGSVASMAYGDPRMTRDMDVVIELDEKSVVALCAAFPDPDWYVSLDAAKEAVRRRRQFNVVHLPTGNKIDFMIVRDTEWGRQQLPRRQLVTIEGQPAYTAHPEDIILGKLQYFHEGGSDKHLSDIAKMLETSGHLIDQESITRWSEKLGVREEWQLVQQRINTRRSRDGDTGPI
jgi:hypothetical protein